MARQNYMNLVGGGANFYWKSAGKWASPSTAAGTNQKFSTNADMKNFVDSLGTGKTVRQVKTFVI